MKLVRPILGCLVVSLFCQSVSVFGAAKLENWRDKQGESFRGTPVDVLGPFALFLTDKKGGKRVLLSQLTEADCVRFSQAICDLPPRANKWVGAGALATRQVLTNVSVLDGETFFNPDFTNVPEPEFLLLFFAESASRRTFEAMREFLPEYHRVRERFGGLSQAVLINVRTSESEFGDMARDLAVPFLIENYRDQADLHHLRQYIPKKAPSLMVMSRTGVPIALSDCKSKSDLERVVLEMEGLLNLMRPGNQRAWPERLYYYKAVRLGTLTTGKADPLLVGHLLNFEALRKAGITTVIANLQVAADGSVGAVVVQPTGGVTPETAPMIADALKKAAIVPAVENGRFVDGSLEVRFEP